MKTTVELNVKDFGLRYAIKNAFNAEDVEVLVAPGKDNIPFRCDWIASIKPIKGIADVIAMIDGAKVYLKWI